MAKLTDLRPEIEPNVIGCPTIIVDDAILKTVVDFCNRSRAYRYVPDDITTTAEVAEYDADLPAGAVIAWLLEATYDDAALDIAEPGGAMLNDDGVSGTPSKAMVISDTEIGLRAIPSASGTLKLRLALRPSKTASIYPDDLHNLYQEGIAFGVLAKLYAQPGKSWSQPGLVQDCRNQYEAAVLSAEYRADRGSANTPARTSLSLIGGR